MRWTGPRVNIRTGFFHDICVSTLRGGERARDKERFSRTIFERCVYHMLYVYVLLLSFFLFSFGRQVESAAPVDQISPGEGNNTKRRKKVSGEIFPRTSVVRRSSKNFAPRERDRIAFNSILRRRIQVDDCRGRGEEKKSVGFVTVERSKSRASLGSRRFARS